MAAFRSGSSKPLKRLLVTMPGGGSSPILRPGGNTGSATAGPPSSMKTKTKAQRA